MKFIASNKDSELAPLIDVIKNRVDIRQLVLLLLIFVNSNQISRRSQVIVKLQDILFGCFKVKHCVEQSYSETQIFGAPFSSPLQAETWSVAPLTAPFQT